MIGLGVVGLSWWQRMSRCPKMPIRRPWRGRRVFPDLELRDKARAHLELNGQLFPLGMSPERARELVGIDPTMGRAQPTYSKAPCGVCGAYRVRVELEDEPSGNGTYYDIACDNCGDYYRTDGPDA